MVTIISMREASCTLCQEKSQGVDAEFKDGTKVYLCRKHFWQALQARSEAVQEPNAARPASQRSE